MTHFKFSNQPSHRTFNNLFDELLNVNWNNNPLSRQPVKQSSFTPAVNIFEANDSYHLEMHVPGRNKEDFKVNVEKGLLTISYEKPEQKQSDDVKTVRREFSFESFSRSFHVDDNINTENILAKYENGLLKFWLPKKEQPKNEVKQINVQ